jgi:hypothetical protein
VGLKISAFFYFFIFWGFSELISILEVEIGRNGPGILGVKHRSKKVAALHYFFSLKFLGHFLH